MKKEILLQQNPNPKLADVARMIAEGDPPKWLVLGLQHFSNGIGVDTSDESRRIYTIIEEMQDAVKTLMRRLPIWENFPYGWQCPKEVAVVLDALPRIKEELDRLAKKRIGRRRNAQREVCAAVVARAWKIVHGRPKPRSDQLLQACNEYWRACGGKQIGGWNEPENWRRTVKRALAPDYSWIEEVLLAVQNEH